MTQQAINFDPIGDYIRGQIEAARQSKSLSNCAREILAILADPVQPRVGSENAISIADIQAHWMQMYGGGWTDRMIKGAVKELVEEHHVPVGSSRTAPPGYYLIVSDSDRMKTVRPLIGEVKSIVGRIKIFDPNNEFVRLLNGQQVLE